MSQAPPNRLRDLRTTAGMSQRETANAINSRARQNTVTADAVSRWERGLAVPIPMYRRLLAQVYGVTVDQLGLTPAPADRHTDGEDYVTDTDLDPRVRDSHQRWRATRTALNANRHALAQTAAGLYGEQPLPGTGLITHPTWLPDQPVDLADVQLVDQSTTAAPPALDGTEPQSALVRPMQSLVRPYGRYTTAVRDLAHPRLFENRMCWRLCSLNWTAGGGRMGYGDTTYFGAVDVAEVVAHELAYVALDDSGRPRRPGPALRDLPYRRMLGDPYALARRPVMVAVSTLTIRAGSEPTFLLHRRDPRSVTSAGGMLQVIPSGIFQPSSIVPAARAADFDLWRNVMREYSEELLGMAECDGDGNPVDYSSEPFAGLERARADGRLRVSCLGVALDALTLIGEVLTVAVIQADLFDVLAADFVDRNDEGAVIAERSPFTEAATRALLDGGRLAPAGAGCVSLAWRWRQHLLG
jgi:transcriptional regulator with XRE-family HTH domain